MEPTFENGGRSFAPTQSRWAKTAALTSAILFAALAAGCGGGETEEAQATAQAAKAQAGSTAAAGSTSAAASAASETELDSDELAEQAVQSGAPRAAILSTAAATSTSDRVPLGVNIEGLWDWARLQPFVDLMKMSRPWGSVDAPWDEKTATDAQGWPTGDAGVIVNVRTFEPGDENKPYRWLTPGTYKLRFAGRADVGPSGSTNVQINNYRYDAAKNVSTADVVVGVRASQLMLDFRNTQGGVKNVSLRLPGYKPSQTFTDPFITALRPFGVVRVMDFLRTNNNPLTRWSERTLPRSATQSSPKGASYEYAIQMANELGKDVWINIPQGVDDAYVRNLAKLLKRELAPQRAVYIEYSNELWNFQFSQTTANTEAAVREAIAGDTTLTNGKRCTQALFDATTEDCNPYWAGYYRVGKQAMRVGEIFSEVYGADAMNKQVRVVYATQFSNPGIAESVLKNIATYRGKPSSVLFGVATAPYFYLSEELAASGSASQDEILQSLQGSLKKENEPFFAAGVNEGGAFVRKAYNGGMYTGASHKALADYYGLKSLAYEGGPDLRQQGANRGNKIAANRSAKMGTLINNEMTQWFGCGNDLFMHFSLSSAWDEYGYWGLTNDPTELTGAKYKAASAVARKSRADLATCR